MTRRQALTSAAALVGLPVVGKVATPEAFGWPPILELKEFYGSISRYRWNESTNAYDCIERAQWGKPPSGERVAELEKNLKECVTELWEDRPL